MRIENLWRRTLIERQMIRGGLIVLWGVVMMVWMGAAPGVRGGAPGGGMQGPATQSGAQGGVTLFIAGDSTAASNSQAAMGWGIHFQDYFEPGKVKIVNGARSGLSSRTFMTGGAWEAIISKVKPHDYVIIQFGHNDNGPVDSFRFRGTMPSLGEETQEAHNARGEAETVHTYGWYMRKMIDQVKEKQANPIVISMTVRGEWKEGKVERGFGDYARLAGELARAEGVRYIDLTNMAADKYEELGEAAVKPFFPRDTTHNNPEGAKLNAEMIVSGIKALHEYALINGMSEKGRGVEVGPAKYAAAPKLAVPRGASREVFERWLNLPEIGDAKLPTIFLIGDSTVRNGRGDGVDGQWGWGDALAVYFDPAKVNLVNRAVGGTSSHSYMTAGYWERVLGMMKPGDMVVMQFGTNDNGGTSLPGVGEETRAGRGGAGPAAAGGGEPTHTFGWYMRKYVDDTRAKGGTAVVCTLVPRNQWREGKIVRTPNTQADWAREVARERKAGLLDLYESIASVYDGLGQEKTTALYADGRVHTGREGAELSAKIVLGEMRKLEGDPFAKYLREKPAANW
jgi:lysophospholipase L1-like esterase